MREIIEELVKLSQERLEKKEQKDVLDSRIADIDDTIKAINDLYPEIDLGTVYLSRVKKSGRIGEEAIPYLKEAGHGHVIKVKESIDTAALNELISTGELKEEDISQYRGKGSDYIRESKRKG